MVLKWEELWTPSGVEGPYRRTSDYLSESRGGWPRWWKASRARRRRHSWGHWVCSAWRREGCRVTSLQSTTSSRGAAEEEVLISLVTRHRTWGNQWSCIRGSSDWTLGKSLSQRGWLVTGTGSPGKWSQHQACQSSRSVWTVLLIIWFSFRQSYKEQGAALSDPYGSLPTWGILWFYGCCSGKHWGFHFCYLVNLVLPVQSRKKDVCRPKELFF